MSLATLHDESTGSASPHSAIASRAVVLSEALANTDNGKLKNQLYRSGVTCILSLAGMVLLVLLVLFGPQFDEKTSVFVSFLLVVCVGMFFVSLFAFIAPVVDVLGLQRITALQKEIETCEIEEQMNSLARIMRQAMKSDNPRQVLEDSRDLIDTLC